MPSCQGLRLADSDDEVLVEKAIAVQQLVPGRLAKRPDFTRLPEHCKREALLAGMQMQGPGNGHGACYIGSTCLRAGSVWRAQRT